MADVVELDALWDFGDPAASEDRFRAFVERARAGDEPILAEALTQLARAQGLQRRFGHADSTLDEAEAALRPDDVRGRIRLDLERGRIANTAGRPGRGAEPFRRAWELARAANEDGLAVDAAHMLGIVEPRGDASAWNERANLEPALAVQEELLAELDALGETDGFVFEEIAECLLALGRDDEARPYFARAWEELPVDPNLSVDEPERLERLRALGE
jgi:tetratricopeptide (TPR) repeat protein